MTFRTLGEASNIITLTPGQQLNFLQFPNDTSIVMTFYINNSTSLPPSNAPGISLSNASISVSLTDWKYGNTNTFELDVYRFGKYIENYPINNIILTNNFPVNVEIFYQYVIKEYSAYYSPLIQDLTQLQLAPSIITDSLTGGTNFRFFGGLSSISFANFPSGAQFYILDQQGVGTSSTSSGTALIPWTSTYTEPLNAPALGGIEDSTVYSFAIDSTTTGLPGSATISNEDVNFIEMDFFSPLSLSTTSLSIPLVYDSTANDFKASGTQTLSAYATYFTAVPARGANVILST